jgi:putative tricarboxylic transport membrane protein
LIAGLIKLGEGVIKHDRISTFFFAVLAIAMSVESIRIGPGSLSNPGPGLVPLGCGLVLGTLSLIVFGLTLKGSSREGLPEKALNLTWGTIWALLSLVVFSFLINPLGFYTVTFLWMGFVCRRIGRMGWKTTIFISAVTTFSAWLLFGYFLEIRFPLGVLEF